MKVYDITVTSEDGSPDTYKFTTVKELAAAFNCDEKMIHNRLQGYRQRFEKGYDKLTGDDLKNFIKMSGFNGKCSQLTIFNAQGALTMAKVIDKDEQSTAQRIAQVVQGFQIPHEELLSLECNSTVQQIDKREILSAISQVSQNVNTLSKELKDQYERQIKRLETLLDAERKRCDKLLDRLS